MIAVVRPGNAAALRLLHKLGMSPETSIEIGGEPAQLHRVTRTELVTPSVPSPPPT